MTEGAHEFADGEPAEVPPPERPPPASPERSPGPSRRAFVAGGALAVLAGAGAGVGIEFWRNQPRPAPLPPAPPVLLAALAAERRLMAAVDSALARPGDEQAALRRVRDDHAAHARAISAAIRQVGGVPPPARPSTGATGSRTTGGTAAPVIPASVAQLRTAETAAARRAATRAALLDGRDAALLASIAACEASHAELLA